MLTNKIIWVLVILLSFSFSSCWKIDNKNDYENKQIEKNIEGKKDKSIWWESIDKKNKTESFSNSDLQFNK